MILICPQCQTQIDARGYPAGQVITCSNCKKRLTIPGAAVAHPPVSPVYLPVPVPATNPFEFQENEEDIEEERRDRRGVLEERREIRKERQAERTIRSVEREVSIISIAAIALSVTTFLFVASGLLFGRALPWYGGIAATFGIPGAISGIICGIIGIFKPGRSRMISIIATSIGALLLLIMIPLLWMMILNNEPKEKQDKRSYTHNSSIRFTAKTQASNASSSGS